jgi:hypothetical protein
MRGRDIYEAAAVVEGPYDDDDDDMGLSSVNSGKIPKVEKPAIDILIEKLRESEQLNKTLRDKIEVQTR